ncbi:uncharacterized protein [Battus philenor]|uniref:uncharacterized protein n=1 Tax=Battus philenor TaxID=42288 RepID=UPI0035D02DE0
MTSSDDTCAHEWEEGPWGELLQQWALTPQPHSDRHGRIMALPPTKGYYVTDRIDGPLMPPPPPPPGPPDNHVPRPGTSGSPTPPPVAPGAKPPSPGSQRPSGASPPGPPSPASTSVLRTPIAPYNYNEWDPPAGSKIVNRPGHYDTFRPSYPAPMPGYRPQRPAVDRVDDPPRKQVSETDLYLLGAIEKLVYRVDLMEKRLRRMEENVHYLVAGTDTVPEPCVANFTRVGGVCYHWSAQALDWKGANLACRKLRGALLELQDPARARQLTSAILADKQLRGNDFWTGGLNPGLLWIWAHSGRPVEASGSNSTSIIGEGRCLALAHDPAAGAYSYRGRDCALRLRYVCQKEEDKEKLANDIQRAARELNSIGTRKAKILWDNA